MADPGRDVGAHVGVELVVLDRPVAVVVGVPRTVGPLRVDEPLVGPLGLGVEAGHVERHGGLDVIPRIAMATGKPRDHPGVELQRGQMQARAVQFVGAEHAGEIGEVAHRDRSTCFTP